MSNSKLRLDFTRGTLVVGTLLFRNTYSRARMPQLLQFWTNCSWRSLDYMYELVVELEFFGKVGINEGVGEFEMW